MIAAFIRRLKGKFELKGKKIERQDYAERGVPGNCGGESDRVGRHGHASRGRDVELSCFPLRDQLVPAGQRGATRSANVPQHPRHWLTTLAPRESLRATTHPRATHPHPSLSSIATQRVREGAVTDEIAEGGRGGERREGRRRWEGQGWRTCSVGRVRVGGGGSCSGG